MAKISQISVILENKPGALAKIARLMADSKLNIEGLMIAEAVGEGMVRIIPDNPTALARILKKNGYRFVKDTVLAIDLTNKPGALAEAAEMLGAGEINIQYAYATGMAHSRKVMAILKVSDQAKAVRLLR